MAYTEINLGVNFAPPLIGPKGGIIRTVNSKTFGYLVHCGRRYLAA